ncbi:hypothetical protein RGQ29_030476 [Quercus rubra]|uniref:Uncharacterized protein n=1 Tax=Quercus rubra TaxID=3512 RepID=A0AAN7IH77_QUERU|nr:hypothetical protein RGQ29_030476 [Quercus rubra]
MDEVSPSNEGKDLGGGSGGADDLSAVAMAAAAGLSWRPRQLAFSPYDTVNKVQALRVVVRRPLVARLTKDFVETYQLCNPHTFI